MLPQWHFTPKHHACSHGPSRVTRSIFYTPHQPHLFPNAKQDHELYTMSEAAELDALSGDEHEPSSSAPLTQTFDPPRIPADVAHDVAVAAKSEPQQQQPQQPTHRGSYTNILRKTSTAFRRTRSAQDNVSPVPGRLASAGSTGEGNIPPGAEGTDPNTLLAAPPSTSSGQGATSPRGSLLRSPMSSRRRAQSAGTQGTDSNNNSSNKDSSSNSGPQHAGAAHSANTASGRGSASLQDTGSGEGAASSSSSSHRNSLAHTVTRALLMPIKALRTPSGDNSSSSSSASSNNTGGSGTGGGNNGGTPRTAPLGSSVSDPTGAGTSLQQQNAAGVAAPGSSSPSTNTAVAQSGGEQENTGSIRRRSSGRQAATSALGVLKGTHYTTTSDRAKAALLGRPDTDKSVVTHATPPSALPTIPSQPLSADIVAQAGQYTNNSKGGIFNSNNTGTKLTKRQSEPVGMLRRTTSSGGGHLLTYGRVADHLYLEKLFGGPDTTVSFR